MKQQVIEVVQISPTFSYWISEKEFPLIITRTDLQGNVTGTSRRDLILYTLFCERGAIFESKDYHKVKEFLLRILA